MKACIALIVVLLLYGNLSAADSLSRTCAWLDIGLGVGYPMADYDLATNIDVSLKRGKFICSLGWYNVSQLGLLNIYNNSANSLHLMSGLSLSYESIMLNMESGIAWAGIANDNNTYGNKDLRYYGIGVPLKVNLYLSPMRWFSIGMGLFYCFDARENFYSPLLYTGFGVMR